MRFLSLELVDTVPDANTMWTFHEALTRAKLAGKPAIAVLFERFDTALAAPRVSGDERSDHRCHDRRAQAAQYRRREA
jgi:hypothetical protein